MASRVEVGGLSEAGYLIRSDKVRELSSVTPKSRAVDRPIKVK